MGQLVDFQRDKRRRHHHFLVIVTYSDGERFGRVYTDSSRARKFAQRQQKSPTVERVLVQRLS